MTTPTLPPYYEHRYSPATTESVAVVRDKLSDARADILVGQGSILKSAGDNTSAILRDANNNTNAINANTNRDVTAAMSQIDKFGLANLNTTHDSGDKVVAQLDRASYGLAQDLHAESDKITEQAGNIAWNQAGIQNAGFAESRVQNESGFYRTGIAINNVESQVLKSECDVIRAVGATDKQVVQSEISLTKGVTSGFSETNGRISDSYARLSEQNCDLKSAIAAAQAAAAECCCEVKQEVLRTGKELGLQAAQNFGAVQVEASKNTGAIHLQAAVNHKESLLEQSKWFALAEKTAMVNKCELEAKLVAYYGELKEAVHGTANTTQALIQSTEANRVRDALSAANTENAILKLRREEHHHYPSYPYFYDQRCAPGPPGPVGPLGRN